MTVSRRSIVTRASLLALRLLLGLMPGLIPAMAEAQTGAPVEPLKYNLSFDTIYDDNIVRVDSQETPATADIILHPQILLSYDTHFADHALHAEVEIGYNYYTANPDRSRLRAGGTLAPVFDLGRCELAPTARFLIEDAEYNDINGPIDNRQRFTTLSAKGSCPRDYGFYPTVEVARDETRNDQPFGFSDQKSMRYTGGLVYVRPSLGRLTVYYTRLDSERPTLGIRTTVDRAGLIFDRSVVSHLSLHLDVHHLDVSSKGAQIAPYRGLGWDGLLTLKPGSGLALEAGTTRRIINDALVPSGYALASEYRFGGRWQIQERFQLHANGEWGERTFRQDPLVIASPIASDRYFTLVGGMRRTLMRGLGLNGNVQYMKRTTDSDVNSYDAMLALVGISFNL